MASKRRLRRKGCERKKRYETEEHARYDAAELRRKTGQPMNIYRCANCHAIHVGHIPAHVRHAIAERRDAA